MKLMHNFMCSFILASVLVLLPVSLLADTSSIIPDTVSPQTHMTPQDLSDKNSDTNEIMQKTSGLFPPEAVTMLFHQPSYLPETDAQNEKTIIIFTQQNEIEEREVLKAASVEGKNVTEEGEEEVPQIPDPLAPVNKVMFHVNDKLYFWMLKPVTQAYSHVIPEDFRIMFSNAYDNLWAPSRILNNLLQLRLKAAGNELIRFLFNSVVGIGGLGDAARDVIGIKKQEADFGQTLGHYGIGHGFYLVLPVFGPSSLRDGVGLLGDGFMYPLYYINRSDLTFREQEEIFAHEKVNDTSFKIGDYESFKKSAIDPYVSMRDAFVQHRKKEVEESKK